MDGDFGFEVWLLRLPIALGWLMLAWIASFLWIDPDFSDEAQNK